MRTVGIKLLKDQLSDYIRLVGAGERVLVTIRGRVVAELGPPPAGRAEDVSDAVIREGIRTGWITPRRFPPQPPRDVGAGPGSLAELLADLRDDRADR